MYSYHLICASTRFPLSHDLFTTSGLASCDRSPNGWSLDPFGMSATQAMLQSLAGFDAWFFTRLPKSIIDGIKQDQSLEFIWRASASLPAQDSQLFAHVYESYYCMPLPTFAFEWGPSHGAAVLNASNVVQYAHQLSKISLQRALWFRSKNVLIPWGCDYQFQNAALVYEWTDWLIETINAHPEWNVHVQYGTRPRMYLLQLHLLQEVYQLT